MLKRICPYCNEDVAQTDISCTDSNGRKWHIIHADQALTEWTALQQVANAASDLMVQLMLDIRNNRRNLPTGLEMNLINKLKAAGFPKSQYDPTDNDEGGEPD